ncbi:hypothetical protein [Arthrobacter sp. ISL-30]|uniref:hypothetical protein n=1 Tax=Arthrobacter sp. ISL-30 TaxID=2819109 RepID=UPI001BE6B692|nr:hypothetical protein [Arthrobacter sp. ISL-30]MBT2515804.1 hypothetical protein [Arthrobacter sp. ISL-30]
MRMREGPYVALQTVNVALFVVAAFLFIAFWVELAQRLARYEARGLYADGDVIKGPAFIIITGLIVTALSAGAFLLLRMGRRWACWIDVLIWALVWFPTAINLDPYFQGFGYEISSLMCLIGILLAVATFFLMPSGNGRPEGSP